MKKVLAILAFIFISTLLVGCERGQTANNKEAQRVSAQQDQYAIGQPIPAFDWSLERELMIQLYSKRNESIATHTVVRSDYGMVLFDTPSIGFGLPYDVSLTNPLVATDVSDRGSVHEYQGGALASIEQAEPNGVYASKNTNATWVMSVDDNGNITPIYTENKVDVFPYQVSVDYSTGKITKIGKSTTIINKAAIGLAY